MRIVTPEAVTTSELETGGVIYLTLKKKLEKSENVSGKLKCRL
jgi:hypothetical protein